MFNTYYFYLTNFLSDSQPYTPIVKHRAQLAQILCMYVILSQSMYMWYKNNAIFYV